MLQMMITYSIWKIKKQKMIRNECMPIAAQHGSKLMCLLSEITLLAIMNCARNKGRKQKQWLKQIEQTHLDTRAFSLDSCR